MNSALPVAERLLALEEAVATLAAQVAALSPAAPEVADAQPGKAAGPNRHKERKEHKEDDDKPGDLPNHGQELAGCVN